MNQKSAMRFVRDIQGPAASILWALLLSGRSLTNPELQDATDYSENSVRQGIKRLSEYDLVQDNGPRNGWSIQQSAQIPLPFKELWRGYTDHLSAGSQTAVPAQVSGSTHAKTAVTTTTSVVATSTSLVDNPVDNFVIDADQAPSEPKPIPSVYGDSAAESDSIPSIYGDRIAKPRNLRGSQSYARDHDHDDDDLILNLNQLKSSSFMNHDPSPQNEGIADTHNLAQLDRLLQAIGIHAEHYRLMMQSGLNYQWPLTWYWHSLNNKAIRYMPGFIVSRFKGQYQPPLPWTNMVAFWCQLDPGQRTAVYEASSSRLFMDLYWWPDDIPYPDQAAEPVMVQMLQSSISSQLWQWPDDIFND